MTYQALFAVIWLISSCVSNSGSRRVSPDPKEGSAEQNEQKKKPKAKPTVNSDGDKVSDIIGNDDGDQGDDSKDDEDKDPSDESEATTGGAGGQKGANELTGTNGLSYMIDVPEDNGPAKAHGLLILLHGSGASNYRNFVRTMAKVAEQHGLIRVSVLAPNRSGWNEGDQNAAAEKLNQLIQTDLLPKYNIAKKKIIFSGQSSGGGFLSSHFVAKYGENYQGGAFLQCGAAPPSGGNFSPDESMKKNFRLHFEITTGDPIWPSSYARATKAYEDAGISLTKDNTKRGGHCAFDQQQVILDHIKFILGDD